MIWKHWSGSVSKKEKRRRKKKTGAWPRQQAFHTGVRNESGTKKNKEKKPPKREYRGGTSTLGKNKRK